MKRCTVCLEEKKLEEYSENKSNKDGRMHRCKECNRKIVTKYYNERNGTREEREDLKNILYRHIIDLRNQGFSLKQISENTGLDQSSISYYINGKRKIGMNAVRKFYAMTERLANDANGLLDGNCD